MLLLLVASVSVIESGGFRVDAEMHRRPDETDLWICPHKPARGSSDLCDISSPLNEEKRTLSCEDVLLMKYCSPRAGECRSEKEPEAHLRTCLHQHTLPTVMMEDGLHRCTQFILTNTNRCR